jgi:hypothetical protein
MLIFKTCSIFLYFFAFDRVIVSLEKNMKKWKESAPLFLVLVQPMQEIR